MRITVDMDFWFDGIDTCTDEEMSAGVIEMLHNGAEATTSEIDDIQCYRQPNVNGVNKPDFNNRLLKEIAHLRDLQEIGIENNRITHCLELLRFIRNNELGIDFKQGFQQENEWIEANTAKTTLSNDDNK